MMKKLTAVLLLTAMTAGLAACGSNKGADTNTDAPAQNEGTEETVTTETSRERSHWRQPQVWKKLLQSI
mgnify:CR=1 FL=1